MGRATASRIALAIIVAATLASGLPRSFAQGSGSELLEEVASHEYGDNAQVRLQDASAFAASGGDAIFEPGTQSEEAFSYDSVDYETNRLIGLTRPDAAGHPVGSFVESVATATEPPAESPTPSPTPTQSGATTTPSDSDPSAPIDEGDSAAPSSDDSAASAGVIPGPCDIASVLCSVAPPIDVGCEGCDTIVEEILDLVRPCLQKSGCAEPVMAVVRTVVYEACGTDDPLYCEDKYSRLVYELVEQLCPYGLTTCADPYVNFVADLIMGIVCPSGSLGYCAGELNREVNDQLAVVVGIVKSYVVLACGGETATDCANRVLDILYKTVLPIVCQAGDAFTCVDNTAERINGVVANACSFQKSAVGSGEAGAAAECVNRVLATVQLVIETANDAMILACQSTDANTCLRNLLETVDETLSLACSFIPGLSTTPGANRCVERTLDLLDLAVEIAQQEIEDTCGAPDPRRCVEMATGEAFKAVDAVNDLLASTCKQNVGGAAAASSSTSDDAVTNCVARVQSTVAQVQQLAIKTANDAIDTTMITACQSTDANTCVRNLLETVDETLSTACSFIPGLSTTPGANRCVERTLALVDLAVEIAQEQIQETCGSTDPRRCVEMATGEAFKAIDAVNDLLANTCKQSIGATTSTSDDAVANCVARVQSTVAQIQQLAIKTATDAANTAMTTACQSTDANTCLRNLLETIDETLSLACSFIPGLSTTPGANRCVERTLDLVDLAVEIAHEQIAETCGSTDPRRCVEMATGEAFKALDAVNDLLANTCKQSIGGTTSTSDDAVANCVARVQSTVAFVQQLVVKSANDAMIVACQSTDANTCLRNLLETINAEVARLCTSVPGDSYASGTTRCTDRAMQLANGVVEAANRIMDETCGSRDALVCAGNVIDEVLLTLDRVNDLVANTCDQDIAGTAGTNDSAVANCVNTVLATALLVQQLVSDELVTRCGSADPAICVGNAMVAIDDEIARTCSSLPGASSSSDVSGCVETAWAVVDSIIVTARDTMNEACGSDDPGVCGANAIEDLSRTIEAIDEGVAGVCDPSSSSGGSAAGACGARLQETAHLILTSACGSVDPATCVQNVFVGLDSTVGATCSAIPVSTGSANPLLPAGTRKCVGKVLEGVDSVVRAACQSEDAEACGDKLFIEITAILKSLCGGAYTKCDEVVIATASYLVGVAYDVACPGQSSEAACLESYADMASPILEAAQATLYQTVCPMSPFLSDCTDEYRALLVALLDAVTDTLMATVCPFDPGTAACAERLTAILAQSADDLVRQACPGGLEACVDAYIERFEPRPQDCELGNPPYEAEDLPPVIPPVCGALLIGQAVLDSGIGAEVPDRGLGVEAHAMTEDGALSFGISTDITGAVYFENVGNELLTGGASPEPTPTPTPPPTASATPSPTTAPTSTPAPSVGPSATPTPSTVPTQTPPATTAPTPTPTSPPTSTPPVGPSPTPAPSTAPTSTPVPSTAPTPTPSAVQSEPPDLDEDVKAAKGGGGASPSPCDDEKFGLIDDRERRIDPPIEWRWDRQSVPDYLGNKDDVLEQIKHGGINWAHVYTNCDDFPSIDLPKLFEFLGVNNEANANMRFDEEKKDWVCRSDGDDLNLVEFGPLENRVLGTACHWHANNNDVSRRVIESDIRLNESKNDAVFYAQGPRPDDCHQGEPGARFDLQSVVTHERGHTLGLDDLSYKVHKYLTMSGQTPECVRWSRTLGRGDFLGLKKMYAK